MKKAPDTARAAFDHLVVMLRDELEPRAPLFEAAGYQLGPPGLHNLGSMNRLIVLDTSYIELLGWPAGQAPRRKEIADQPMGLDALVFRSEDAAADERRLRAAGFNVNPVSHLERPVEFQGATRTARFDTVRFASQPVSGLRIYFCRHLTPEYVWHTPLMRHANHAKSIRSIYIEAPDAAGTARVLATLVDGRAVPEDGRHKVALPNAELIVVSAPHVREARILRVQLQDTDGGLREFETGMG